MMRVSRHARLILEDLTQLAVVLATVGRYLQADKPGGSFASFRRPRKLRVARCMRLGISFAK